MKIPDPDPTPIDRGYMRAAWLQLRGLARDARKVHEDDVKAGRDHVRSGDRYARYMMALSGFVVPFGLDRSAWEDVCDEMIEAQDWGEL